MSLLPHDEQDQGAPHTMVSKRNGVCSECEQDINEGDQIVWDPKEYKAYCMDCGDYML